MSILILLGIKIPNEGKISYICLRCLQDFGYNSLKDIIYSKIVICKQNEKI